LSEPVKRIELPAKWNLHDRFFVKDVSWFSDGNVEVTYPNGRVAAEKYKPPYNTAFLDSRFEITSWTNWNGISMPRDFKLTAYRPDYASTNVAKFVAGYTVTGSLEQIQNMGKFSPVPQLNMETRITDLRIIVRRGLQPTSYISTNQWDIADAIQPPQRTQTQIPATNTSK
jgi:hypothetical protein